MSTRFYNGTEHVFYSDNSDTTTITAKTGSLLNINSENLTSDNIDTVNIDISGTLTMKSDVSRYGSYRKSVSQTTVGPKPVVFTEAPRSITGLTYSMTGNSPNYNGSWTNQTLDPMVLLVNYSVRFTATTGTEIRTFLAANQTLDPITGEGDYSRNCQALCEFPTSTGITTCLGSITLLIPPNNYFALFYTNGTMGSGASLDICSLNITRLL